MEEIDVVALTERIQRTLQRRVEAFPEDASEMEYAQLLAEVRAMRALSARVHALDNAGSTAERDRTLAALQTLAVEAGR